VTPEREDLSKLFPQAIQAAGASIDRLHILANIIRKSSAQSRNLRARAFAGEEDEENFEQFALLMVKYRFKEASESLCEQLAMSMAMRRKQFVYKLKHQNKLAFQVKKTNVRRPAIAYGERNTERHSEQPVPTLSVSLQEQEVNDASETRIKNLAPSQTNASTLDSKLFRQMLRDSKPPPSTASAGTSIHDVKLDYPPPPITRESQKECICPYCCEILPTAKVKTDRWWKKHVDADLEPYVCISEKCKMNPVQFVNFDDWKRHMSQHGPSEYAWNVHLLAWLCPICKTLEPFRWKEHFVHHMKSNHSERFTQSQLSTLARRSTLSVSRDAFMCPLCNCVPQEIERIPSEKRKDFSALLPKHIASHLKSLLFLSLPYRDDINEDMSGVSRDPSFGGSAGNKLEANSAIDLDLAQISLIFNDDGSYDRPFVSMSSWEVEREDSNIEAFANDKEMDFTWDFIPIKSYDREKDPIIQRIIAALRKREAGPSRTLDLWQTAYNEEGSLSVTDGNRKKRRGYYGSPVPSTNEYSANQWTYNDYTVAVVCAMGFEMRAVRYMLDDEHPRLPTKQGDSNLYVLGEISGHNVVIAYLPGTQGKGAAAIVANNMQRTFPSIKWRLLVGIGGGVPSPIHDIRLGDIVVSMPDGLFGGVVQYDLGKDVGDGFTLKGFLWPPPPILRSAVEMMQSDHLTKKKKVNTFLSEMLQKWPGLAEYQRPPAESDVLFQTDYPHVPDQATFRRCERTQVIDRPSRVSDHPKIHYGLIASGDRVIRSAIKRNKTGRDIGDILCFEMEAAGIMTEFPCIVIRGISDYADSHKNDKWQHYAAAAAAGCAKELLSYLDPEDRQVPSILSLRQPLHGQFNVSRGLPGSTNIPTPRQGSPAQQSTVLGQHPRGGIPSLSEEHKRMLLDSLKFDQIDARQMAIKKAHAKTCRWLLSKPEYLDWLDNTKLNEHHGFLWMKGKPGTGKSTIMKFALADARKTMKDRMIVSFFFNARGEDLEKSTVGLYRALLSEILERVPELQCVFDTLELRTWNSGGHHQWGVELLKDLFEQAILRFEKSSLMCFIDALDECAEHEVRDMISFFEHVGELSVDAGIQFRVLLSSRYYPYITIKRGLELILEGQEGHIQDITNYVNSELKIGHSNHAMQIRGEIQEKASGVFMWVILVVEILNKEYNSGRALQQILHRIPGDLHELFRDLLTRDGHNRNELLLCIQWVLFARQPLKPEELYFAIVSGIEPGALTAWNTDVLTIDVIRRFILNSSKGLAEVTHSKAPMVRFIHESVRDFFLKENGLCTVWPDFGSNWQGQSHDQLKQCCLTYLNVDVSKHVGLRKPLAKASSKEAANLRDSVVKAFPFLEYAVRNVLYHADAAEGSGISQGDFINGFQLPYWVQLDNLFKKYEVRWHTQNVSLLYILAENNLSNLIRVHSSVISCFDVEGERYLSPFFACLATGSGKALQTLLQAYTADMHPESRLRELCDKYCQDGSRSPNLGRDFNFSDHMTVLSRIAELDELLFAFLLETGKFMPDSRDKYGRTPLLWAAVNGSEAIVKLLLSMGHVNPDSKSDNGRTPLSWAAETGNEATVKLLLLMGNVDPDSKDNNGRTPLLWAAAKGNEAIVKLLLATGRVDPDSKDRYGQTPLSWAAEKGNEVIVKLLLASRSSRSEAGMGPRPAA
jgi:nucleoside phosphorylase